MRAKSDHIIVVDDDPDVQATLKVSLERWGFHVTTCKDARHFWQSLEKRPVDLVILDLNLPDEDGLLVCRNLRARSMVPVIMLTGRTEEVERVIGLEIGADDYLVKPVAIRELVARIKSVLRRSKGQANAVNTDLPEIIRFAGWTLETSIRRLVSGDGEETVLTHGEFRLLQVFIQHPNRALTRDQLLDLTQRRATDPFDRSIDIQISRLRRCLKDDPRRPRLIQTMRGEGYLFSAKVEIGSSVVHDLHEKANPDLLGKHVLVVDDDELFRVLLENLLTRLGCEIISCGSSNEATEIFNREHFDFIFMDCHMPVTDGFVTATQIRRMEEKSPHTPPIPIIAVSSRSRLEEHDRCVAAGMNDFLEKPVRLFQVKSILQRWLLPEKEGLDAKEPRLDSPVDEDFLRSLSNEVGKDFSRMIQLFIDNTPGHIYRLEQTMAREAFDILFPEILRLLGSALNLGASRLASYCHALSSKAAAGEKIGMRELLLHIREESERVIAFLKVWDNHE